MNYFVVDTGQSWCPEFTKRRWKPRTTRWVGGDSLYIPLTWAGSYMSCPCPITDCHHHHWGQAAGGWEHWPHSDHWDWWWEEANNSERRHKCSLLQWGWCFLLGKTFFFSGSETSPLGGLNWNGQIGSICISEQGCLFSSKGVWAFHFVLGTRKGLGNSERALPCSTPPL